MVSYQVTVVHLARLRQHLELVEVEDVLHVLERNCPLRLACQDGFMIYDSRFLKGFRVVIYVCLANDAYRSQTPTCRGGDLGNTCLSVTLFHRVTCR